MVCGAAGTLEAHNQMIRFDSRLPSGGDLDLEISG